MVWFIVSNENTVNRLYEVFLKEGAEVMVWVLKGDLALTSDVAFNKDIQIKIEELEDTRNKKIVKNILEDLIKLKREMEE